VRNAVYNTAQNSTEFCIVCSCFNVLMFHVQSSIELLYAINHFSFFIFNSSDNLTSYPPGNRHS